MHNKIKDKIINIPFYEEKIRFLLFAFVLLLCLFLSYYLFKNSYAKYISNTQLVADVDKAIYLVDSTKLSFNIDPAKIVPSDTPYKYTFSVSNFKEEKSSELDISYNLKIITTTNLPLLFSIYRNENPDDNNASALTLTKELKNDVDGSWYNVYSLPSEYNMPYTDQITDIYTLVITFPKIYSNDTTYADCIENIEVVVESKQVVE